MATFAATGCACRGPGVDTLGPALVEVSPVQLALPATFVGSATSASVDVVHRGGAATSLEVGPVDPPFSASPLTLEVPRGETRRVRVDFAPLGPGHFAATLKIGDTEVALEGEGREQPVCTPSGACVEAVFDPAAAACVETPRPDETSCSTRCVTNGSCAAAVCTGQLVTCDDSNACTVDACSEAEGCWHAPRVCPAPSTPCRLARCEARTGCLEDDAPDGTLCGVDDCLSTQVDVCIDGQCTPRLRPDDGRCVNRWVPTQLDQVSHPVAYDVARQRAVRFGDYTWEFDGSAWTLRIPAASPPQRSSHAMAWDSSRSRTVLFGGLAGGTRLSDTWEWDGQTWVLRNVPMAPPPRRFHALAYDDARQRLVLFGGWGGTATGTSGDDVLGDTWEWDGNRWAQQSPPVSPPVLAEHALAFDSVRQRTLLFGGFGSGGESDETWEWDGATWTKRTPAVSPPKRANAAMAFDVRRGRMVLFGGSSVAHGSTVVLRDTWEWDGATWVERSPVRSPPGAVSHTMVYDAARQRLVLVAGHETWEWDGATWWPRPEDQTARLDPDAAVAWDAARQQVVTFSSTPSNAQVETWLWGSSGWSLAAPAQSPTNHWRDRLAYDAARQRVVLYGGVGNGTQVDTWLWDGANWSQNAASPNPGQRDQFAMAYDPLRQRVVLFGGTSANNDTWEWDGSAWARKNPPGSPAPRYWHTLSWDGVRQRVLMVGGVLLTGNTPTFEQWEWDGTTWSQLQVSAGPVGTWFGAAYDESRQRVVLPGPKTNEWDGTAWVTRTPLTPPPLRCAPVYEARLQKVVCFASSSTPYVYLP